MGGFQTTVALVVEAVETAEQQMILTARRVQPAVALAVEAIDLHAVEGADRCGQRDRADRDDDQTQLQSKRQGKSVSFFHRGVSRRWRASCSGCARQLVRENNPPGQGGKLRKTTAANSSKEPPDLSMMMKPVGSWRKANFTGQNRQDIRNRARVSRSDSANRLFTLAAKRGSGA